jgi:hypothetical protein
MLGKPFPEGAGLEMRILRRMPELLLAGTVPLALCALVLRDGFIDIVALAIALAYWMSLAQLALGCLFVSLLKGPRRSADSYHLPDGPAT